MVAMTSSFRRAALRLFLVALALTAAGATVLIATADAGPTTSEFSCKTKRSGFKFCKAMNFPVTECRLVGARHAKSSKHDGWIKVQVRKPGVEKGHWTSGKLQRGEAMNGKVDGEDTFEPSIWIDASGYGKPTVKVRVRFSGKC